MYELKRSKKVSEQIKLGDDIIDVNIDVDEIATGFKKAYNELALAEKAVNDAKNAVGTVGADVLEQYGKALITLLQTVFGVDNTVKLLEFYENRYIELSYEVLPFIVSVVFPAIQESANERREKLSNVYANSPQLNRAQRRKLGL